MSEPDYRNYLIGIILSAKSTKKKTAFSEVYSASIENKSSLVNVQLEV